MRTYILKTFKYLFKQNIFTSLISVFLLSVISIMFSFCNFNLDKYLSNYQDATYQQYKIISTIGQGGIGGSGFVLGLGILFIVFFIFYFLNNFINYKYNNEIICLMKIKGFNVMKSNGLFYLINLAIFFINIIFSIIGFYLISLVITMIFNLRLLIVNLSINNFVLLLILFLIYMIISLPFYFIPYNNEKIIKTIRNFY
mgnify:FL=1